MLLLYEQQNSEAECADDMVALSIIPFSGHTSERFVKAKRRDWQPD